MWRLAFSVSTRVCPDVGEAAKVNLCQRVLAKLHVSSDSGHSSPKRERREPSARELQPSRADGGAGWVAGHRLKVRFNIRWQPADISNAGCEAVHIDAIYDHAPSRGNVKSAAVHHSDGCILANL